MAATRSYYPCTVLRAGLNTLEMRVAETEQGKGVFIQGWSNRPFDNAAPLVEGILHAMCKQRELLLVLPFRSLRSCNLFGVEA